MSLVNQIGLLATRIANYLRDSVMAGGNASLDFGAAPGQTHIEHVITGQTAITLTSKIMVQLSPANTADHSADEHVVDGPVVFAGNIIEGVGFTIYARGANDVAYGVWNATWSWKN